MNCAKCNRILDGEDVGGWNLLDEPVCFPCAEQLRKESGVMPRETSDHEG